VPPVEVPVCSGSGAGSRAGNAHRRRQRHGLIARAALTATLRPHNWKVSVSGENRRGASPKVNVPALAGAGHSDGCTGQGAWRPTSYSSAIGLSARNTRLAPRASVTVRSEHGCGHSPVDSCPPNAIKPKPYPIGASAEAPRRKGEGQGDDHSDEAANGTHVRLPPKSSCGQARSHQEQATERFAP
jgi:hypothetical protein